MTSQFYTRWNLSSAPSLSLPPTAYITLKKCVGVAGENQWHSRPENEMFFPVNAFFKDKRNEANISQHF